MILFKINKKTGKKIRITIPDWDFPVNTAFNISISSNSGDVSGDPANDTLSSYSANIGAFLNGLNGYDSGYINTNGIYFAGAYVDKTPHLGVVASDDLESYTLSANLNGLNSGNGIWSGSYVDKTPYLGIIASDDLESYTLSADLNGLNSGNGNWSGQFVDR